MKTKVVARHNWKSKGRWKSTEQYVRYLHMARSAEIRALRAAGAKVERAAAAVAKAAAELVAIPKVRLPRKKKMA